MDVYKNRPIISKDFLLEVKMGMYPGYSTLSKYGRNLTVSGPSVIWEQGGAYTYDAVGAAPIISLSSSDNADNQNIEVFGLDIDGFEVIQIITLTGQIRVALTTPLWRVYRMRNVSDAPSDVQGTVYCYTTTSNTLGVPDVGTERAIIVDGTNGTFMALYTIPRGKVGFLYRGEAGLELSGGVSALAEFARTEFRSRAFNKNFISGKSVSIVVGGEGNYKDPRSFPDVIPALTDISIIVSEVSVTMGLWATFDLLLVDEGLMSKDYLEEINQPFISI